MSCQTKCGPLALQVCESVIHFRIRAERFLARCCASKAVGLIARSIIYSSPVYSMFRREGRSFWLLTISNFSIHLSCFVPVRAQWNSMAARIGPTRPCGRK